MLHHSGIVLEPAQRQASLDASPRRTEHLSFHAQAFYLPTNGQWCHITSHNWVSWRASSLSGTKWPALRDFVGSVLVPGLVLTVVVYKLQFVFFPHPIYYLRSSFLSLLL